jgi:hypothetical protein
MRYLYLLAQFKSPFPKVAADQGAVNTIMQVVFSIAGAICLLIITLAGFKYVISRGEPQAVAKAKNTIIYAVIGLAITILAYAIVSFAVREVAR